MSDPRAQSFGAVAELYDQYRPPPPEAAAALLGDLHGLDVLEVAAGTGIWSRFLLSLGAELTIVEPDDQMRAVLVRRSPGVHALIGTAEALPVDGGAYDLVVVSSAWHWFRQPDATIEMARVLREGGRLVVQWNGFGRDVEWVNELAKLRDQTVRPRSWRSAELADSPLFRDVEDFSIDWTWRRTTDELIKHFGTYSGAIVRTDEERQRMRELVRAHLDRVSDDDVLDVPMTLRGTIARRSAH
ncbi:MAG: class I SAM-dependent methyltransferase [Acidimicrobiales bacterium]|jgi:SAM-dependent methyltransferase